MPLSTEARLLLDELAARGGRPIEVSTPDEARVDTVELLRLAGDMPAVGSIVDHNVEVAGGEILVRVVDPVLAPRATMLFFHGGGWVVGDAANHTAVAAQLAAATRCKVVVPDYRLAPEVRFPVPIEDCYAATKWAASQFDLPVIVMGDSAGGNIAATVAILSRDRADPPIVAQALFYPVTDCRVDRQSFLDTDNHLILTPAGMRWFWDHYLPDAAARVSPLASPLRLEDHSDLPPAIVILARHDILFDEGLAFAEKLAASGVPCSLHVAEGEPHAFLVLGSRLPAAGRAMAALCTDLDAILGDQSFGGGLVVKTI